MDRPKASVEPNVDSQPAVRRTRGRALPSGRHVPVVRMAGDQVRERELSDGLGVQIGVASLDLSGTPLLLGSGPGREPPLVVAGSQPQTALEVPMQMALVGETGGGGRFRDRPAGLEQASGGADAVGDVQRVRR